MPRITLLITLWIGLGAPGMGMADTYLHRPAACEPQVTVQMLGCRVDNVYTCPGDKIWTESFEGDGDNPTTVTTKDGDLIWQGRGENGVLAKNTKPAFSIGRAMTEGGYKFDMPLEFHLLSASQATVSHGTVTPLPGTVTISGYEFHRFDVYQEAQLAAPAPLLTTHDVNYYAPNLGFVIFGEAKTTIGDTKHDYNWVPVVIIKPGEKGFLSNLPGYGCGELSLNLTDEKADHS